MVPQQRLQETDFVGYLVFGMEGGSGSFFFFLRNILLQNKKTKNLFVCLSGALGQQVSSCTLLLALRFAFMPTALSLHYACYSVFTLCIHWQAEHRSIEGRKGKFFFEVASKQFLLIIFVQKQTHCWKERNNHTFLRKE